MHSDGWRHNARGWWVTQPPALCVCGCGCETSADQEPLGLQGVRLNGLLVRLEGTTTAVLSTTVSCLSLCEGLLYG
jgi:hypothetical protein